MSEKITKFYALDTETTGLEHAQGDRIIEIGIVEIDNFKLTGREFHAYLDPENRLIDKEAEAVHGISNAFLKGKPTFSQIASQLDEFIGDGYILIQNAAFDVGFIDAERARAGFAPLQKDRVIDNIEIARRRFPGSPTNLDALCRRLKVDNSARDKHGALLDAQLLAKVFIAMEGVVQKALDFSETPKDDALSVGVLSTKKRQLMRVAPTPIEIAAHRTWIEKTVPNALWATDPQDASPL